jgi:hypothetical protein
MKAFGFEYCAERFDGFDWIELDKTWPVGARSTSLATSCSRSPIARRQGSVDELGAGKKSALRPFLGGNLQKIGCASARPRSSGGTKNQGKPRASDLLSRAGCL